ncbi:MAG: pilus assembly protein [Rhodobacteraceae bacterium]|nr:pilus assembly protein [Paracoccaceae bacterium]
MGRNRHIISRFRKDEDGAAMVEFAVLLPMLLLIFAMIIEGGRLMWAYQTVNAGVRDAARYLARVAPPDLCKTGGVVTGYTTDLENIVRNSVDGAALFPSGITVTAVVPSHSCVAGSFRISPAPVAQVTANLTITFPFASVFGFAGQSLATINTSITDQSRVYGS